MSGQNMGQFWKRNNDYLTGTLMNDFKEGGGKEKLVVIKGEE